MMGGFFGRPVGADCRSECPRGCDEDQQPAEQDRRGQPPARFQEGGLGQDDPRPETGKWRQAGESKGEDQCDRGKRGACAMVLTAIADAAGGCRCHDKPGHGDRELEGKGERAGKADRRAKRHAGGALTTRQA